MKLLPLICSVVPIMSQPSLRCRIREPAWLVRPPLLWLAVGGIKQVNDIINGPKPIGNTSGHRWSDPKKFHGFGRSCSA